MYNNLLNLDSTIAKDLLEKCNYPWEALPLIKEYILKLLPNLGEDYIEISENVYVHKTAKISSTACINGPTIIGKNTSSFQDKLTIANKKRFWQRLIQPTKY